MAEKVTIIKISNLRGVENELLQGVANRWLAALSRYVCILECVYFYEQRVPILSGQKQSDNFGKISQLKRVLGKIFEGEIFIRSLPTTPLQIFCKTIHNFQVIVKSIKNTDNNFMSYS